MKKKIVCVMILMAALLVTGCGHKNETFIAGVPEVTETPKAPVSSENPEGNLTAPAETGAPEPTGNPAVETSAPAVTGTPEPTGNPVVETSAPVVAGTSEPTGVPAVETSAPEVAGTPEPTGNPAVETSAPVVTGTPEPTGAPAVETSAPAVTVEPEPAREQEEETPAPAVTVEPEPAREPEEETPAPAVTEEPQPTEPPISTVECKHKNGRHEVVTREATCSEYGEVRYACNDCGYFFGGGYHPPQLEHNFSDGVCTNCGVAYCDHEFTDVVWREPDCRTGAGSAYEKCTKCGYIGDWKDIPYEHDFEEVMGFEGDCKTTPSYTLTCRKCGWEEKRDGDSFNMNNHRYVHEGTYTDLDLTTLETVTYFIKSCWSCGTIFEEYEISRELIIEGM